MPSMHTQDYIDFAKAHWIPIAIVIGAIVLIAFGYSLHK